MQQLAPILSQLSGRHRLALEWFHTRSGTDTPWPSPISGNGGETLLATQAKGIYKPEWTRYALSVRQTLESPYSDLEPIFRGDGTWIYPYFQEGTSPTRRDERYTNLGLMECMRDRIPVGVMRQLTKDPRVLYRVLGVALVTGWDDGYFFLEGFSSKGEAKDEWPAGELEILATPQFQPTEHPPFDPKSVIDARVRTLGYITRRRGQPEFRKALIHAYDGMCALSGCDALDALEAAHIVPYRGPATDRVDNGLLLRADLHTLFDLGLIAIDSLAFTIVVGTDLRGTSYSSLSGAPLRVPQAKNERPSTEALAWHREWAGL